MTIDNDKAFKAKLNQLSIAQQRRVAARFVQRVLGLCGDVRVRTALDVALREDASEAELAVVAQAANSAHVESYTQCGRETDWSSQAGHFVARAAVACVGPVSPGANLAWEAAMQARMARTCEMVATGEGTEHQEAEAQFRILDEFMNQLGNRL
jgi:hypothetical protein